MNNNSAARDIGGFLRNTLAVAMGALTLAAASGPVVADDSKYKLEQVRLCDTSACYVAWNVVDSDHDGVADADELMAGTNPFDPQSRPALPLLVELAEKYALPSFEAGLATFFVFPPELQAAIEKSTNVKGLLSAFPLAVDQPDGLARFGISADLLKEHGIDANTQGLTIGLELGGKDKGPDIKVGGMDMSLVSAGDDDPVPLPTLPHGGIVKDETIDGDRFITYADGYLRGEFSDGSFIEKDKDGKTIYDGTIMKYVNPDADTGSTAPTPEQEKNLLRLRGAAIRTVEGWSAPKLDGAKPDDPRRTLILVDPDYLGDAALVFDLNAVTTAQPETRPDLPSPGVPAGSGPKPADCTGGGTGTVLSCAQ